MTKTQFALATCVVSFVGVTSAFGLAGAVHSARPKGPIVSKSYASWAYKTKDPARMSRDVNAIVIATLEGVSPGRVVYSSKGEAPLAFELNSFRVEEVVRGTGVGQVIQVERVATDQGDRVARFDFDGGPFVPKTRYLLFLNRQSSGNVFYQVNDEGRFAIDGFGRLRSRAKGAVATSFHGRSIAQTRAFIAEAVRAR